MIKLIDLAFEECCIRHWRTQCVVPMRQGQYFQSIVVVAAVVDVAAVIIDAVTTAASHPRPQHSAV